MNISDNFTSEEFACKGKNCCGHSAPISKSLVLALELLRAEVQSPLTVNSGFRCRVHNKEIGGADKSKHCLGIASDIKTPKHLTDKQFFDICCNLKVGSHKLFGGVGLYEGRVHVDTRVNNDAHQSQW